MGEKDFPTEKLWSDEYETLSQKISRIGQLREKLTETTADALAQEALLYVSRKKFRAAQKLVEDQEDVFRKARVEAEEAAIAYRQLYQEIAEH